jgi:hypothetical protein
MGALTSLNLSANRLGPDPTTWNKDKGKYYVASTSSFLTKEEAFSGVAALAGAIRDMGALTKFDISKNDLRAEGAKIIANILPKCT